MTKTSPMLFKVHQTIRHILKFIFPFYKNHHTVVLIHYEDYQYIPPQDEVT